jgi:hypothetical protein
MKLFEVVAAEVVEVSFLMTLWMSTTKIQKMIRLSLTWMDACFA